VRETTPVVQHEQAQIPSADKLAKLEKRGARDRVELARMFEALPDSALVDIPTVGAVIDQADSTTWRRLKSDPTFVKPIAISPRCTRVRVGDLRSFINGGK